jgi:hypothetical protein
VCIVRVLLKSGIVSEDSMAGRRLLGRLAGNLAWEAG